MNTRSSLQPHFSNSQAIRNEIQRFEGVHPSIYAIYDLIELAGDTLVAQQIRDHVVCIEDSFVNSQEWTLSRDVPDLRLGIVGSLSSCKSALVHRYLTGSYMQEESPEGGRFKKEILVEGKSYLLLIRDEGGPPEQQFTAWVDAVIFVFSVENESSFNAIYTYYSQMAHFRKSADIPFILVGTQDAICETNPRVIDESRARKLATDLKRCTYWETCATYGLHVERVFEEACQKIVQQRNAKASCVTPTTSRPSTPNAVYTPVPSGGAVRHHTMSGATAVPHSPTNNGFASPGGGGTAESPSHTQTLTAKCAVASSPVRHVHTMSMSHPLRQQDSNKMEPPGVAISRGEDWQERWTVPAPILTADNNNVPAKFPPPPTPAPAAGPEHMPPPQAAKDKDLPTPSSTPTTARKSRRRSNLFAPKKGDDKLKNGCELGSGRDIPAKQGFLSKRSSTSLNKEFKKKYVTIRRDGTLVYYPSVNDYIAQKESKEINLQTVTVKKPGQMPCTSKAAAKAAAMATSSAAGSNGVTDDLAALNIKGYHNKEKRTTDKVLLTAYDLIREPTGAQLPDEATVDANQLNLVNGSGDLKHDTANVKKRHRRMRSSGVKHADGDDSDREFLIISLTKQWHFMAADSAERDEWVRVIEEQILNSIQALESSKAKSGVMNCADTKAAIQYIRTSVAGNAYCVDCDSPNPEWASLNLGVLMCIQCSGTHRNLGSHISRVRSLQLDDWPLSHTSVMIVLGNTLANSVWEADMGGRAKPTPDSSQEEKERWIRNKYEGKQFLAAAPPGELAYHLFDAVNRSDMRLLVHTLAHCTTDHINSRLYASDMRTPLHVACANADLAMVQLLIWNNANVKVLDAHNHTLLQCTSLAWIASRNKETVPTVDRDQALLGLLRANGCLEMADPPTPPFGKRFLPTHKKSHLNL